MKVWVVLVFEGDERFGEPKGVFSTREKAEEFVKNVYPKSTHAETFEMEVS